jgi:hypothetical protein
MEAHAVPIDTGPAGNVGHSDNMKQLQIIGSHANQSALKIGHSDKYEAAPDITKPLKLISSDNTHIRQI